MFWLNKSSCESTPRHFGDNTQKKLPLKKKRKKKNTGTWGGSKEVTSQVTLDSGQVTGDWTGTVVRSNKLTAACPLVCTGNWLVNSPGHYYYRS
jgi:hypothetical protein